MSNVLNRWLFRVALLCVVVSGFGALTGRVLAQRVLDQRESRSGGFWETYAERLRRGELDSAWSDLTTEAYRQRTSFLVFQTGQARNEDELGEVIRLVPIEDDVENTANPEGVIVRRQGVVWAGERVSTRVVFDLIHSPEGWRIDRTWQWNANGLATERVY